MRFEEDDAEDEDGEMDEEEIPDSEENEIEDCRQFLDDDDEYL